MDYVFTRHARHHDAAFVNLMWEIWEGAGTQENPRYQELEHYLNAGFWHQILYKPPLNALAVSVEGYDRHCLQLAQRALWAHFIKDLD